jgi:23S rRNA-/tRNA-specific pseudouridylate synthase
VHMAIGLQAPILGDRLYGTGGNGDRLYLHAQKLTLPVVSQCPDIIIISYAPLSGVSLNLSR